MSRKITAGEIANMLAHSGEIGCSKGKIFIKQPESWWKEVDDLEADMNILHIISKAGGEEFSAHFIGEIRKKLTIIPELQLDFENIPQNCVNLKNGVFDIDTGEIEKATAQNVDFPYVYRFEYKKNCKLQEAPCFEHVLRDAFDEKHYEKKVRFVLQMMGYIMSSYTCAKTAFFVLGPSDSGKSVLLELLGIMMGEENISSMAFHKVGSRFNLAKLLNVRANISTEISSQRCPDWDIFKQITSGERVTAEYKGKAPFTFRVQAKLISAGNVMPPLEKMEGADAIIRRMKILLFDKAIPLAQQDKFLLEKLKEEVDVIGSLSMDALMDLKANNFEFVELEDAETYKGEFARQGAVFQDFVKECCEISEDFKVHLTALWDYFQKYCHENLQELRMTKTEFSQNVAKIEGIKREKFRICGSRPLWGFKGIRIKREEYAWQDYRSYSDKPLSLYSDTQNVETTVMKEEHLEHGTEEQ